MPEIHGYRPPQVAGGARIRAQNDALPPLLAISRCLFSSIEANPRLSPEPRSLLSLSLFEAMPSLLANVGYLKTPAMTAASSSAPHRGFLSPFIRVNHGRWPHRKQRVHLYLFGNIHRESVFVPPAQDRKTATPNLALACMPIKSLNFKLDLTEEM